MEEIKTFWHFIILSFMMANQENFVNLSFVQANLNKSQLALSDLEHNLSLWSEPDTKIHIALL